MSLPCTTIPVAPASMRMPEMPLAEMRLLAPVAAPPMVSFEGGPCEDWPCTAMPYQPLPIAFVPDTSVPM